MRNRRAEGLAARQIERARLSSPPGRALVAETQLGGGSVAPAVLIEAIRICLAGESSGERSARGDVESMLLDLAGPAMNLGQLNRLLAVRAASDHLAGLLAGPEAASEAEIEASRARSLAALDDLAGAFGLPTSETRPADH
jgi:hypothetical protein